MTILDQLLTDPESNHDIVRWLAAAGAITGLVLEIYSVVRRVPFDIQAFGIGYGSLLGGLGASLALKSKEPPASP